MSFIVTTMCIALCACGEAQNSNSDANARLLALQMKINISEAALLLYDSNTAVLGALYAEDQEESLVCFKKALELVKETRTRVDASISSPNFISKGLEELEENYEKTTILLSEYSELSEEKMDEFTNLIVDGGYKHIFLLKSLNALAYLNEIRDFDQSTDDEANIIDILLLLGFSTDIERPETIDEQELYLIWAEQFFGEFDEYEFLKELRVLRENDDLSSTECNKKWTEFIENFISEKEAPSS